MGPEFGLDDPYYYLYFGEAPRPPSYWELEAQDPTHPIGRVLRFDSFSKVLSAGLRMGFVTGPKVVVEAINIHVCLNFCIQGTSLMFEI
jgi:tryptophan aminotransferase